MAEIDKKISEQYDKLSAEQKRALYKIFENTEKFSENYFALSQCFFSVQPPSPEEFLDPKNGWISANFIADLRDWVKESFVEIVNDSRFYSVVSMYGATRLGKTHLALLLMAYTIVWFWCLKDPNGFYGLSEITSPVIFIVSYKLEKVNEVYLDPLFNLLEKSPMFHLCQFKDQVAPMQKKLGRTKIAYAKSSSVGHITLDSGLSIASGNRDALQIIGSNILSCFISEISYFIEAAGATEEDIFRLYTDIKDRIHGTMGDDAKLSFTFLDTSANSKESMIEKHILEYLQTREDVYFKRMARWEVKELAIKLFPTWYRTGETFKVCTGDGTYPAKVIENEKELIDAPAHLIIDVPIDAKEQFETALLKSIKDIAGIPSTAESKFIQDGTVISDIFRDPLIKNFEHIITADSASDPEDLIWPIIRDLLFMKIDSDRYIIRRAQDEPRWLAIDVAKSVAGDVAGIAMGHKEWSTEHKKILMVHDFVFAIGPGEKGINLEAMTQFIRDLVRKGRIRLMLVLGDQYESGNISQSLMRSKISFEQLSTDRTLDPYMLMFSLLLKRQVLAGKNIFLKNNLHALHRYSGKDSEKINHTNGKTQRKYFNNWETSDCGKNAKDVSDASCRWIFSAFNHAHFPSVIYEEETERQKQFYGMESQVLNTHTVDLSYAYKRLHKYGSLRNNGIVKHSNPSN